MLCEGEPRRLNDGVTDPVGRYLVGSAPTGERTFSERLWLVDHDRTVTVLDDDLGLSNGLAFSADGSTLYSVDTFSHVVRTRPYDVATGAVGVRRDHVRVDDGYPDGIALDAEDHLWVAVFGQGEVRRFAPDGTLVDVVRTPGAPQATNVCFAGPDRRTLVITTAREDMTDLDVAEHPESGRLFSTRVDVPGLRRVPGAEPPDHLSQTDGTMKLMRIGAARSEKPAALVADGTYVDLSDVATDFDEAFFGSGGIERIRGVVAERAAAGQVHELGSQRVGAPFARPHQILCIGLNYSDHAAETGQAVPEEPILFTKSPNTLIGPDDDVLIPRGATKPDWEVELGIVIGRRTSYLDSVDDARDAIAGYCVVNDVSERAFQMERGGQWSKGKSCETFNPAGPWLVTPDEIDDVLALDMWLDVSGVRRQTGTTATMIFDPHFLVHYLSQFLVLEPGDLINTGTPPGVGLGFKPPVWLQPGDVMELGITGLGTQRQNVLAPR